MVFFSSFFNVPSKGGIWGFPGISAGKESARNAGDPGSIPGSGSSPGEGIGYPLQYSWASLVAQLIKNPSAVWETWVRSLGWEDPLEKGKIYVRSSRKLRAHPAWPLTMDSPYGWGFPGGASGKEPICQYKRHKRC